VTRPIMTAATLALALAGGTAAAAPILVTDPGDAGPGTLRAALAEAAARVATARILVITEGDIDISSTLTYEGRAPLTIHGRGQTVATAADVTLLAVTEGADLVVDNLSFAGPGGYSIEARGDSEGPAGKGIFLDLRDDQTGLATLVLNRVSVSGVAGHGVHVSDCDLADECGGGGGGAGGGSRASINVHLTNVSIESVGRGAFDSDGLRVDERGAGGIRFLTDASTFSRVGADGVELDEGQAGSVSVTATGARFTANGDYCDPAILGGYLPEAEEGAFEDDAAMPVHIPAEITGSPDDSCIEREVSLYDSGAVEAYEFGLDLDDGFDVDEAGPGGISALLAGGEIAGNFDEGLDFDEEGPGGIDLTVVDLRASGNSDDALKVSEEDDGDVAGIVLRGAARDNGGVGLVFEEAGSGDLTLHAEGIETAGNDGGETAIEAVQEGGGSGTLSLVGARLAEAVAAEGVSVREE